MTYGMQVRTAGGNLILDISDRTPRLVAVVTTATVGNLGTTSTISVSGATTDSVVLSSSGAATSVTTSGSVNIYGTDGGGTTNLRVLAF